MLEETMWRLLKGRAAVKLELKESAGRVYVYDDENVRLELRVPPAEVFRAFVKELDRLAPAADNPEKFVKVLARAFWLLHQRPRRRGLFGQWYAVPEADDRRCLNFLSSAFPEVKTMFKSLPAALFGLVRYAAPEENRRSEHGVDYAC
jgi:hypothetical protein